MKNDIRKSEREKVLEDVMNIVKSQEPMIPKDKTITWALHRSLLAKLEALRKSGDGK